MNVKMLYLDVMTRFPTKAPLSPGLEATVRRAASAPPLPCNSAGDTFDMTRRNTNNKEERERENETI